MKKHLLLDFDETLFNYVALMEWIDAYVAQRFGVSVGSLTSSMNDHYEYLDENTRFYQPAQHFQKVIGRSWCYLYVELERELKRQQQDFCYPEVHAVLKKLVKEHSDIRILTFGNGEYQRFKIHSCHVLQSMSLPIYVATEPKRDFLAREFGGEPGILVDDKYPLHLPLGWLHVWINRKEPVNKTILLEPGVVRIGNLSQLAIALKPLT